MTALLSDEEVATLLSEAAPLEASEADIATLVEWAEMAALHAALLEGLLTRRLRFEVRESDGEVSFFTRDLS